MTYSRNRGRSSTPRMPPTVPVAAPTAPPTTAPTGPAALPPAAAPSSAPRTVPCAYAAHGNVATANAAIARNFIFMVAPVCPPRPKTLRGAAGSIGNQRTQATTHTVLGAPAGIISSLAHSARSRANVPPWFKLMPPGMSMLVTWRGVDRARTDGTNRKILRNCRHYRSSWF